MAGGGKTAGQAIQVVDYNMSIHAGVCVGPVDSIRSLTVGDKFVPFQTAANGTFTVDFPELFGGPKQAGGISGDVHVLLGGPTQTLPAVLAKKLGRTVTTVPGFRNLCSLFFTGAGDAMTGFKWGSQNPMLPAVEVEVQRMSKGFVGNPEIGPDLNPAHMIYEIMTNADWGRGEPLDRVNIPSLLYAADIFRNEGLGMSFIWTRQKKAGALIQDICNHVDAHFFFDLAIGQWRIKPVRNDYDIDTLPVIEPAYAQLLRLDRPAWGSTINEIQVQWTNPESEQTETLIIQDDANIGIQGGVINSDSKDYYGFRNQATALFAGQRELQRVSAPMIRAEVALSRHYWNVGPGDAVRLRWPSEALNDVVFRVAKVDRGSRSDEALKASLIQDIFSSPYYQISTAVNQWVNPSLSPVPINVAHLGAAPYYLLARLLGDATAQGLEYPSTKLMALISKAADDTRRVDFKTEEIDATGANVFLEMGSVDPQDYCRVDTPLTAQITSTIDLADIADALTPFEQGMFLIFVDEVDPNITEVTLLMSVGETSITVRRGVLDTVPRAWAGGSRMWAVRPTTRIIDLTTRPIGSEEKYLFLPVTSLGRLPDASADVTLVTPGERAYLPYRPAHPRVGANAGPVVNVSSGATNFTVNWYRRNRLSETGAVLKFDDIDVTPEAGQTTTVRVLNGVGAEVVAYTGEAGTSKVITLAAIGSPSPGAAFTIELLAVRDGFESLMASTIGIAIT